MKSKINAMQTDSSVIYPFMGSVRCGAKTRQGTACQSPAVRSRKGVECMAVPTRVRRLIILML